MPHNEMPRKAPAHAKEAELPDGGNDAQLTYLGRKVFRAVWRQYNIGVQV